MEKVSGIRTTKKNKELYSDLYFNQRLTYKEIGKIFNVSAQRIQQIVNSENYDKRRKSEAYKKKRQEYYQAHKEYYAAYRKKYRERKKK